MRDNFEACRAKQRAASQPMKAAPLNLGFSALSPAEAREAGLAIAAGKAVPCMGTPAESTAAAAALAAAAVATSSAPLLAAAIERAATNRQAAAADDEMPVSFCCDFCCQAPPRSAARQHDSNCFWQYI